MSVTVRPYRHGGGEVDITIGLPNGLRWRERSKAPTSSKSAAIRWGEDRERHLLQHGLPQPRRDAPTLAAFAPRFVDGYAIANRLKPSGVVAKESIIRVHFVPLLGSKKLDAITNEDVQRVKRHLIDREPKTVNNVLTTLNVLLKAAVSWGALDRMPCAIRLLPVPIHAAGFLDFQESEQLLKAAASQSEAYVAVLLGGEAGLRCGAMMALERPDINMSKRQLCVRRSDWRGQVTVPKGGRLRYVPMTTRLAAALRKHRHLRSDLVLCHGDGTALTQRFVDGYVRRAARTAGLQRCGPHMLRHTFCSHLAMRGAPARAIQRARWTPQLEHYLRYMHLSPAAIESAIRLLEPTETARVRGDSLETGENPPANSMT